MIECLFFRISRAILFWVGFLLCGSVLRVQAQHERSVLLGVGSSSQLDTYLSPMEYRGLQFSFLTSTERMTPWADRRISFQQTFLGAFSNTENPAATANEWGGRIAYDVGYHYHWHPYPMLQLQAGALVGADAGFLYNSRNGNNPAQGRAGLDLSVSVAAAFRFRIRRLPMHLRYQADVPVMGGMFSPQYGQSYYELYLGNRDHNVCFTHPGNALSIRQLMTWDFHFRRTTLRLGYLADIRQSHVNRIRVHDISHSLLLGYVHYFRKMSNPHASLSQ